MATRAEVAQFLPSALKTALKSYRQFMAQDVAQTPKEFGAHHTAGKVALAHVDLLLKLARWADLEEEIHKNEDVGPLLRHAQLEFSKFSSGIENNEDDPG